MIEYFATPSGRLLRTLVGLVLIVGGLLYGGIGGLVVAIIGIEPFLAGVFDFSLTGPLFGRSVSGARIRAEQAAHP